MGAGDWAILVPLLLTAFGGQAVWVLSRLDKSSKELVDHERDDSVLHNELRAWARELFADKTAVARIEERIVRIDLAVDKVTAQLDALMALLRDRH